MAFHLPSKTGFVQCQRRSYHANINALKASLSQRLAALPKQTPEALTDRQEKPTAVASAGKSEAHPARQIGQGSANDGKQGRPPALSRNGKPLGWKLFPREDAPDSVLAAQSTDAPAVNPSEKLPRAVAARRWV